MLQDIIKSRKEKLEALAQKGINPYPDASARTHKIKKIIDQFTALSKEKAGVVIAGRIRSMRTHGGSVFVDLEDESAKLQVYLKRDVLGKKVFGQLKYLDLGDFIEVEGTLFQTRKGENSILGNSYRLLGKALRPLPEKWKGLKDQELRYRKRYLDLLMNPEVRERFRKRAQICDALRDFLTDRGFLEVDTPVLQTRASGALARPFITHHETLDVPLYLRIAPETYLKRLIVGGFERVFEMARVFRNEGMDTTHLQDFTMLEFYWAYKNYEFLMQQTEEMFAYVLSKLGESLKINYQGKKIDFTPPWPRVKFTELIKKDCGIDIERHNKAKDLRNDLARNKIRLKKIQGASYASLCDQLYKKVSRPKIIGPLFLIGHPLALSPLARRNDQDHQIVDRFQLVVLGQEIVNAYSELIDPLDQRERFREQAKARAAGDQEAHMMDEDYVEAMEYGMPPMAGWGMGIDRLVMLLTNAPSIREALFFPLMRPKSSRQETKSKKRKDPPKKFSEKDKEEEIKPGIERKKAWKLICKHVKNPNSRKHMLATEAIIRALAVHLGCDQNLWGLTGLLHDLDMEIVDYENEPQKHGPKTVKILKKEGVHPVILKAILAHNEKCGAPRETRLEKAIYAIDPLTGLIVASCLVLPSRKLSDLRLPSVLKRFKEKSFARGARREVIASCVEFGLSLEEFVEIGLKAMQKISDDLGL